MIHELFENEFSKRVDTAGAKKIAIQRADHVVCISENTKQDLIALHGTPEKKITVVHLGCDTTADLDEIAILQIERNRPYLLYVGGRAGYKNFNRFLQAVSTSSKLKSDFDIIAFGGGAFTSGESELIRSYGFGDHQVQQVSGNDTQMQAYYAAATAFVYPSLYEGFGIPPLEAMSQKCPVICSNVSSMPEVAGEAAEYFSPLDIDSIRSSIEVVVYSASRSNELKVMGANRLSYFSWNKCVRETQAVYRSLS
jgi:glycosyltransferase involved in cell wall biosynthesis